jgi:O-antigen/teichoic acid export membrane protein
VAQSQAREKRPEAPSAATIARAGGMNLVARLASGAAALGLAVLSTNVLDTHGRGVYAILATWAGIALTIITSGTPVLAADLIHGRHDEATLHGAAVAIAVEAALLLLPLAAAVSLVASGVTPAALLWTAAVAVLLVYANFEMAIAQARGDVLLVSLTDIGIALGPLVAAVVAVVVFDPSVTTLLASWAVGAFVTASVQFARAFATGGLAIRRVWRIAARITRRSLGIAVANGTSLLCSRIDVLVVAAVVSTSAAGIYSIPVALSVNLLLFSRALLTATYRSIMTAPGDEVAARLGTALRHSVIVVLVAGSVSVPLVALLGGFVFGGAYSGIWRPYAVLVPAAVCISVAEMLRHFVVTRLERQREIVVISLAMLLANGVLAVVGAAEFGIIGAAASTTITYAGGALGFVALCSRQLSVPMLQLTVPRRSDLATYVGMVRVLAGRSRSAGPVAP